MSFAVVKACSNCALNLHHVLMLQGLRRTRHQIRSTLAHMQGSIQVHMMQCCPAEVLYSNVICPSWYQFWNNHDQLKHQLKPTQSQHNHRNKRGCLCRWLRPAWRDCKNRPSAEGWTAVPTFSLALQVAPPWLQVTRCNTMPAAVPDLFVTAVYSSCCSKQLFLLGAHGNIICYRSYTAQCCLHATPGPADNLSILALVRTMMFVGFGPLE